MSLFGSLKLGIQWIGRDGEPFLRSDKEPGLIQQVQDGTSNVGWGESVKFDLDPNDKDGKPISESDVPGRNTKYPLISWRARIEGFDGEAKLDAIDENTEGEVDEGSVPIHLGTRPYDESKGYSLKVVPGWRKVTSEGKTSYKPETGRRKVTVYAYEIKSGIRSNEVSFWVS